MFYVVSKEKIYSYIISILTVFVLFAMSSMVKVNKNTTETGAYLENDNSINVIKDKEKNTSNNNCYNDTFKSIEKTE